MMTLAPGVTFRIVTVATWLSDATTAASAQAALGQLSSPPAGLDPAVADAQIAALESGLGDDAPVVTRLAGADRYGTAAAVSAQFFAPGVDTVFIATGDNFPDALAGGPAGRIAGAPVLLTRADSLPGPTIAELERLSPAEIVVLGGHAAISESVVTQLGQYTDGEVSRIAGANRFETAALISDAMFPGGAPMAYVATGAEFPDALAGGPAAGAAGAPILLVDQAAVPAVTLAELTRLAPEQIVVLGGPNAVAESVVSQLQGVAPTVRQSGSNRYTTAVAVSGATFGPGTSSLFLATGADFQDALSGASLAGITGAPILLARPHCIPAAVGQELARLSPDTVYVLGWVGAARY